MTDGLYLTYPSVHQLHQPTVFFVFGDLPEHPESPDRIKSILVALSSIEDVTISECNRSATFEELCSVHTPQGVN